MSIIDRTRLDELQTLLGAELPEILAELTANLRRHAVVIDQALAVQDLERAARAAHDARNDALMVGARQLLPALERLEQAARACQAQEADAEAIRLKALLPATVDELQRVTADFARGEDP